eukprot:TRINITY_DN18599_c0_g1_i2.p1 TRINITY_DN18599_c0_g1~~TRINITY_DN18599_c0_g1_i2.p1  ORF type:complete len:245 (+),score=84.92 TRINITY_DN18599_c0_g1_i2:149-883(+)
MALGLAAVQLGSGVESAQKHMGNDKEQSIELGLAVVLVGCLCSGFAGVYFESMMKPIPDKDGTLPKNPSMWIRNSQLAVFSLLIGVAQITANGTVAKLDGNVFRGFTPQVQMMVLNNALGGLLVAFVIKHADNLLKGFACALATVIATLASVPLFGYQIGTVFMCGVALVLCSTLLYGGTVKMPDDPEYWEQEFELCAAKKVDTNVETSQETRELIAPTELHKRSQAGDAADRSDSDLEAPAKQ